MLSVTVDRPLQLTSSSTAVESSLADTARRLHRTALEAFRLGNCGRFKLGQCLRALQESRQYLELGAPSIEAYARCHFRMSRSATFEAIRVTKALDELAETRRAFLSGALDWSSLRELTRIALPDTEGAWVKFACEHTTAEVAAEVRDAEVNQRKRPRERDGGLPNLDRNLVIRLRASEHERVMRGLERLAPQVSERLGGASVDTKQVLLFLAEWLLETEPAELLEERRPRVDSTSAVIYRRCSACRDGEISTEDGWVGVGSEELDRVEGSAWVESLEEGSERKPPTQEERAGRRTAPAPRIDAPTSPVLRRKVLLRDGGRCANPHCDHRADHAHHIVFRMHGGKTSLENEVAVCSTCHALIHAGLLRVRGTGSAGLDWQQASRAIPTPDGEIDSEAGEQQMAQLPEIRVVLDPRSAHGASTGTNQIADPTAKLSTESTRVDWLRQHGPGLEYGLGQLGIPKQEARDRIRDAVNSMAHSWTEAEVLRRALIPQQTAIAGSTNLAMRKQ